MGDRLSISERLGADAFATDTRAHLSVSSNDLCVTCKLKPCIRVCPAQVYEWAPDPAGGKLLIHYENCLETGACRTACHEIGNRALIWEYPRGSRGVAFRFG